jgi:enolase
LAQQTFAAQAELDQAMIELDGTANKSHLGATILAVSLAFARAVPSKRAIPPLPVFRGVARSDRASFAR